MRAILSDIHGNLHALTAVLADAKAQGAEAVYNLGDTLGYGPNPVQCLDLTRGMALVLLGNFDYAVLHTPDAFCQSAERSILWTQDQLSAEPAVERERREVFLSGLSSSHREGDLMFVHGSPRNTRNEYVYPEDIDNGRKMGRIGELSGPLCFAGHTHIPGIFAECGAGKWEYLHAEEVAGGFPVAGRKIICNVGAVGQPRDDDERACYVLFDGERIWFRRIVYDVEATIRKIYAVPELDNFLGDRLREGR